MIRQVRDQSTAHNDVQSLLVDPAGLDPAIAKSLMDHPMPHWVEQMTINYIELTTVRRPERAKHGIWFGRMVCRWGPSSLMLGMRRRCLQPNT